MTNRGDRPTDPLDRLVEIVRRDLGAGSVDVVLERPGPSSTPSVERALPDGRWMVATLAAEAAVDAAAERLDALLEAFSHTLESAAPTTIPTVRPPVSEALHRELVDLVDRASGADGLLLDASTPIVWCSAGSGPAVDRGGRPMTDDAKVAAARLRGLHLVRGGERFAPGPAAEADLAPSTRRAVELLREQPEVASLSTGVTLRRTLRAAGLAVLARSLGGIYLLGVVFETETFDEIRAERAMAIAAPRVERLLAALPPLDPTPDRPARVVSLRGPRRS